MTEKDIFLKKIFKKYYYNNITKLSPPKRLSEREIGYLTFSPEKMIRHLNIQNEGELKALILHEAPKAVYYSSAYYEDPSAPINARIWKGADLIFDIDLDHLPNKEGLMEKFYICNNCKHYFSDSDAKTCPECSSQKIEEIKMATTEGLTYCKQEVIKLIDVLSKDFGVSRKDLNIYFSGKRGYHLTLEESQYESADQTFRLELSDYLLLNGFRIQRIFDEHLSLDQQVSLFPSPWDKGSVGRFSKKFCEEVLDLSVANLEEDFFRNRLMEYISKTTNTDISTKLESIRQDLSIKIDVAVTTDIHRIFRMPDTLHGGTGFVKKKIMEIDSFLPLVHAVVLSDEPTKIYVYYVPKFELKGQQFGPYKKQEVTVPEAVAVFLVAMNVAQPLESK
ncbi:MAG: DNA primase small subunit domain-containing protein [Nitrososphaeria archaeon]